VPLLKKKTFRVGLKIGFAQYFRKAIHQIDGCPTVVFVHLSRKITSTSGHNPFFIEICSNEIKNSWVLLQGNCRRRAFLLPRKKMWHVGLEVFILLSAKENYGDFVKHCHLNSSDTCKKSYTIKQ
jgi:hypothetical protein